MMRHQRKKGGRRIWPLLVLFVAGGVAGWWLHSWSPQPPATVVVRGDSGGDHAPPVIATPAPEPTIRAARPDSGDLIADLDQALS